MASTDAQVAIEDTCHLGAERCRPGAPALAQYDRVMKEDPENEEPPFAEPPASATPRVRRGSLLADPFDPWAAWRSRVRPLELAA